MNGLVVPSVLRRWVGPAFTGACLMLGSGCDREVFLDPGETIISGYEIQGRISDRFGTPVPQVRIRLFYYLQFLNSGNPPAREYDVPSGGEVVRIAVYDYLERLYRVTSEEFRPAGPLKADWDDNDLFGNPAPSGMYWVRFEADGDVQLSYPVLIFGTVTAVTDQHGSYRIGPEHLPMAYFPFPVFGTDDDTFYGYYEIEPFVDLQFVTDERIGWMVRLEVKKDRLTRGDYVFN
ncbi:MAG: hypothetical protein WD295_04195 [Bacteroidota bacterium]